MNRNTEISTRAEAKNAMFRRYQQSNPFQQRFYRAVLWELAERDIVHDIELYEKRLRLPQPFPKESVDDARTLFIDSGKSLPTLNFFETTLTAIAFDHDTVRSRDILQKFCQNAQRVSVNQWEPLIATYIISLHRERSKPELFVDQGKIVPQVKEERDTYVQEMMTLHETIQELFTEADYKYIQSIVQEMGYDMVRPFSPEIRQAQADERLVWKNTYTTPEEKRKQFRVVRREGDSK